MVTKRQSNEVLDPFCGCGTTVDAAGKLGRDWIGIEVTQLAISLTKHRRQDTYGRRIKFVSGSDLECARPRAQQRDKEIKLSDNSSAKDDSKLAAAEDGRTPGDISLVRIIGEPITPNEAATLAEEDKHHFQW